MRKKELRTISSEEVKGALEYVYENATNRSRPKTVGESSNTSPKDDECKLMTSIELCLNMQYHSWF